MSKYLLYISSGGLTHMLSGLAYCCDFIKRNNYNYKLIIFDEDLNNIQNKYVFIFRDKILNYFDILDSNIKVYNINNFKNNNKIKFLNKYSVDDILNNEIYYKHFNKYCLNIDYEINLNIDLEEYKNKYDNLILCGPKSNLNICNYIKLNDKYIDICNNYFKKINNPYIGIHYRNTDITTNINNIIEKINKINIKHIYIATDDFLSLEEFNNKLEAKKIIKLYEKVNYNGDPIHYTNFSNDEKIKLFIDMYILYKSNIFIMSPDSRLSDIINLIRNDGFFFKKKNIEK